MTKYREILRLKSLGFSERNIAVLRNELFFSFAELNAAIRDKLDAYNIRKFKKRSVAGSVYFLRKKCHYWLRCLLPPLNFANENQLLSSSTYYIAIDKMFYSVPFQYIKEKFDVRITETTIEIFFKHSRIASHCHLYGRPGQYSMVMEHMTEDHQKYLEWNGDRFRKWADSIGINISKVVDAILTFSRVVLSSWTIPTKDSSEEEKKTLFWN